VTAAKADNGIDREPADKVRCGGSNLNLVWPTKAIPPTYPNLPDVLLGIPCTNTRPSQVTTQAGNVEITCHSRDTLAHASTA
jgi:hypothetical protein